MATVNLAACKIAGILFGMPRWETLLIIGLLNVTFAAHSGLWGALVIDMIQFFVKMTAVIAAAWFAVKHVGGLHVLVDRLSAPRLAPDGKNWLHYLNVLPDFHNNWEIALAVFIMPLLVNWWAVWYPGSEPGGGSFIAQRMLASKSEKDSLGAVLFFNVAHYVLRPWPWILVGLASLLVYPELSDIQKAFPNLDPKLLGHDIAYPAMLKFLPVGFIGLMVGGLIAANSSTILTLLNWGSSYLVHDFYRRFLNPTGTEKHYVWMGRLSTVMLFLLSAAVTFVLGTAKDSFDLILQVGAGTGLLYLVRWFWWRVNAWCEVIAMISSFGVSVALLSLQKAHHTLTIDLASTSPLFRLADFWNHLPYTDKALLITISVTTLSWVLTAFFGPQTDRRTLIEFYRKVKPFGPGWNHVRAEAGPIPQSASTHENVPLALVGWAAGCSVVWSALFTVGSFLYGRWMAAFGLLTLFIASSGVLIWVMNRLWSGGRTETASVGNTARESATAAD
jgi:Na+/proline symporter